jgi:hypothetical protein
MSFDEFQHHARLYVVGALDEEEMASFEEARHAFREEAEEFIRECRKLNAAFALSLRPRAPRADSKDRLMGLIRASMGEKHASTHGV